MEDMKKEYDLFISDHSNAGGEQITMEIKEIKPTDKDYPIIMCLVDKPEKYTLFNLDGLVVVPLWQVIDALLTIKPDVNVVNGVKYCPNCGAKMKEEDEINVGDEVILNDGDKAVVTEHHSDRVCVVRHDGCTSFMFKDDIEKTSRTFPEIAEVLKKMQEDE